MHACRPQVVTLRKVRFLPCRPSLADLANRTAKGALATGGVSKAKDETYGNTSSRRYFLCYKKEEPRICGTPHEEIFIY